MTYVDYIILFLVIFFSLLSFSKGIIAEIISIFKWLISILGAKIAYKPLADLIFPSIHPIWFKQTLGFGAFFLICFMVLNFFKNGLERIIRFLGLNGVNRGLGIIFGVIKGMMIVTIAVFVFSYTDVVQTEMWQRSVLLPYFQEMIIKFTPFVNDMLNSNIAP